MGVCLATFALVVVAIYSFLTLILYSDLKPDNIGFGRYNRVHIFDFGLARELSGPNGKCYGRPGTVRYMAPEVIVPPVLTDAEIENEAETLAVKEKKRKERGYGLQADIFSYAILLWHIVTVRAPYEGELVNYINPQNSPQVNGRRPSLKSVCLRTRQGITKKNCVGPKNQMIVRHFKTLD